MNDRRKTAERRGNNLQQDRRYKCNQRVQPDRRLNNIKVEWIAINHINIHPATRLVFSRR
ncbi:MAG: hypothetical protein LJE75_09050 [Gammaproteobacteria bacterium]|nr:hypothetical protein [Gammaproteobacteria bacterium]